MSFLSVDGVYPDYDTHICGIDISHQRHSVNVTYSGNECQDWDSLTTEALDNFTKRFDSIQLPTTASNFCQDPASAGVLWCYTFDPEHLWEPCVLKG